MTILVMQASSWNLGIHSLQVNAARVFTSPYDIHEILCAPNHPRGGIVLVAVTMII